MKPILQYALAAGCGLVSLIISPAQIPDAPLKYDWYRTSIIIFTRPEVSNENTAEMLFVDAHRSFPGNARAFPFDPEKIEYYNPLSLRTALALEWPILAMRDPIVNRAPPDVPVNPELHSLLDKVDVPVNMAIQPVDPPIIPEEDKQPTQADLAEGDAMQAQLEEPQPEKPSLMALAVEAFTDYESELENQSLIPLPENEHLLDQELTRLKRRDDYRVLYTATWNQAIPDRNNPAPILVQAGERKHGLFELEGTIAITLGRYLHAKAELWLHKIHRLSDREESEEAVQGIEWMQLSESRRMRSTELHYLDHPKFGLLIRVDPIEIPERLTNLWREAHFPEAPAKPGDGD